jgi:IS1 family transposase
MIKQKPQPLKLRYRDDNHMKEIIQTLSKSNKVTNIKVTDGYVTYDQLTFVEDKEYEQE